MGDIPVDWSAGAWMNPEGPAGIVNSALAGQEAGLKLGQAKATVHALQGVDLNNPASIDAGIGNLVHANALDQANALQGLGATRQIFSSVLPAVSARLKQFGDASPASAPAQPPQGDDHAAVVARQAEIMGQAQKAVSDLQALPLGARPAAAQAIREQFLAHGVPAAAIDGHLDDLSDAGLAATGKYFTDHAGWMSAGGLSAPGGVPEPPHPTGYAWANDLMNDPLMNHPLVQATMKKFGFDMGGQMDRAERLIQPWNAAQATAAYAGQTEEAKKAVDLAFSVPEALVAAKRAGAVASAEEAARSPFAFENVKGPNGQDVYVRKDYALSYAAQHGGVLGQGIAPAEQAFRTAQGGQTADLLKPDPAARNSASDAQASAQRALSIIRSIKFNLATPIKAQVAAALRTAGFADADKYASDIANYQAATTAALVQGAHSAFPSRITDRDIKLMHDVYPTLKTPNDQAAIAMGTQAAQALRTQQWEDFKANYSGPHESPQDVQKAWLAGPGGQSILQSSEWANIPIGGRAAFNPATDVKTIDPKTQKVVAAGTKGSVKVGAWGIGTGHPVYFVVQ